MIQSTSPSAKRLTVGELLDDADGTSSTRPPRRIVVLFAVGGARAIGCRRRGVRRLALGHDDVLKTDVAVMWRGKDGDFDVGESRLTDDIEQIPPEIVKAKNAFRV